MTKKPPKKRLNPIKIPRADADSQPASRKMLSLVRDELNETIEQVRIELKEDIRKVRIELTGEIEQVRGDVAQFRAEMKINFSEIRAITHRTSLLVEEQNANNRIVLEGLQALWQRQDRLERA